MLFVVAVLFRSFFSCFRGEGGGVGCAATVAGIVACGRDSGVA